MDEKKPANYSTPIKREDRMHDAALLPMYSSPGPTYNLQSDIESTQSEMEDSFHMKNMHSSSIDIEQMLHAFQKIKGRLLKYKGKYSEVGWLLSYR